MLLKKIKYPKTMHLPWSPGLGRDDKVLNDIENFKNREIVITEKMDGENTTIAKEFTHARSINSGYHQSRSWVKRIHGSISHKIPENMRIHGENLLAVHSIPYRKLPSYFLVFGISVDDVMLSWDETENISKSLGLYTVPVLYKGDSGILDKFKVESSMYDGEAEGYVVRIAEQFDLSEFSQSVAKYVRKGHVQTDDHWMNQKIVRNGLII